MDFYEVLDQVVALPRTRGRVTSRALKLQFHLDDEHLETLKEELIEAQRVAADEDGKVLVWVGTHAEGERANRAKGEESLGARVQSREVKPVAYTPRHLAERIRAEQAALEARGSSEGERKTIPALFADLKGSTALIEGLDPEEARALIDPALQLMMDAVHRYEGAVVGVGGVGSNVVQVARAFGAGQIIAVDVRDDKLEAVKGLGATHTVNATRGDAVAAVNALTNGRGVDVAIEALGRPETVVNAFMMTRDGGRVVVIGIAPGTTTAGIEITRLVRRGIQLMGSYGSRVRTDLPELLALAAHGQVSVSQPITRRYRLEQVDEAYATLQRGEIIGRAIITI